MSPTKSTAKSARRTDTAKSKGFTAEEKAAMKERARELKAEAEKADGEKSLLDSIAKLTGAERATAKRLHALISANVPSLAPKTWYGMPAYAKDGKIVCFYQAAQKFQSRYASFGFTDEANLDDGDLFPVAFGLKNLTPAAEARLIALVKQAVS